MRTKADPAAVSEELSFQILILWVIWGGVLVGMGVIYFMFGQREVLPAGATGKVALIGVAPLIMSALVRWLLLPRVKNIRAAFPVFVIGLGLAEGAGVLAILLGGPYREEMVLLSALAVLQFAPIFAVRQFGGPRPRAHGLRGPG